MNTGLSWHLRTGTLLRLLWKMEGLGLPFFIWFFFHLLCLSLRPKKATRQVTRTLIKMPTWTTSWKVWCFSSFSVFLTIWARLRGTVDRKSFMMERAYSMPKRSIKLPWGRLILIGGISSLYSLLVHQMIQTRVHSLTAMISTCPTSNRPNAEAQCSEWGAECSQGTGDSGPT